MAAMGAEAAPIPIKEEEKNNSIEPFYVLHRSTPPKKKIKSEKAARKIDLPDPSLSLSQLRPSDLENTIEFHDVESEQKRIDDFYYVWSNIDKMIKSVMHDINSPIFDSIHHWIRESFNNIELSPSVVGAHITNRLFTAFVISKNMEFVDDLQVFEDLETYFRSNGFHVASLSSLDFSTDNDVSDSVKSLLTQFIQIPLDAAADIFVLETWYWELGNNSKPLIVVVRDMERCCGSILSDFILMVGEIAEELPVVLIMGVSTSMDAAKTLLLPTGILSKLHPFKFLLPSPDERMEETVKQVLVKSPFGSCIGRDVALFLRNNFLVHDGSFSAFVRGLKVACVLHFSENPLTPLPQLLTSSQEATSERSATLLCIHEVGKRYNLPLLDLLSDAAGGGELTRRTARGMKDLPAAHTAQLLSAWAGHTTGVPWMREKVEELSSTSLLQSREAAGWLESMAAKYVKPHQEAGDAEKIRSALVGDVRKAVQIDLRRLFPDPVHDTSVLYGLAQEHGDVINVHDWYWSFHGRCGVERAEFRKTKKRRGGEADDRIQARFCRAAVELQLAGLIRATGTRNPHHVHRVGFGI